MPIYEYRCEECGRVFEMLRRFSDADRDLKCPVCESEDIRRQVSSFAASSGSGNAGGCAPAGGGRRYG
ncbi:MAG: zinc ribbon domain-containing protein [Bryobacterales bacterium]|nr:zinc ribbon domain-containing protein [Bryobacterales bacterium]